MSDSSDLFIKISKKVGMEEDKKYREFYNSKDPYGESLGYLAIRNFKRFVAVIYYLISEKEISFDLVIGAGSSGVALARITEIIYQSLGLKPPLIINIPIVRYKLTYVKFEGQPLNLFDNSILIPETKKKLKDIKKIEKILFVDDEIKNGITVGEAIKVILNSIDSKKVSKDTELTIVAEDQGFNSRKFSKKLDTDFYYFSKKTKDLYGVINYIVPLNIEKRIKEYFNDEQMDPKTRINILLDLPVKETYRVKDLLLPKAKFSYKYNSLAKKEIPNFSKLQEEFQQRMVKWINEAIREYVR